MNGASVLETIDKVKTDEEVRSREEGRGVPVGFIVAWEGDNLSPMMVDG